MPKVDASLLTTPLPTKQGHSSLNSYITYLVSLLLNYSKFLLNQTPPFRTHPHSELKMLGQVKSNLKRLKIVRMAQKALIFLKEVK